MFSQALVMKISRTDEVRPKRTHFRVASLVKTPPKNILIEMGPAFKQNPVLDNGF